MSFWNFFGGFAVFNAFCNLFFGKPNHDYTPSRQYYHDYEESDRYDELQDRIDSLEDM